METFIYSLAVAALGGLTILAYRHPEAYQKLSWVITSLFIAIFMFMIGWNYAATSTWILLGKYIPPEKGVEALTAFRTIEFSIFQSLVLPIILFAYHLFLGVLPLLIHSSKKPDA